MFAIYPTPSAYKEMVPRTQPFKVPMTNWPGLLFHFAQRRFFLQWTELSGELNNWSKYRE